MLNESLISAAYPRPGVNGAQTRVGDDVACAQAASDLHMDESEKAGRLAKRVSTLAAAASRDAPKFGRAETPQAPGRKKRAKDRPPTFKTGRVIFSGRSEAPCVIKDLTDSGARIVLEGEAALPPQVTLVIATTGTRKEASVIWQADREVGLSFAAG